MYENSFQCLTKSEEEYFLDLFMDRLGNRDSIYYSEFRDIVSNYSKFNKNSTFTSELLEKVKKKIKERQSGITENELNLNKNEFMEHLEFIASEHNRMNNERDPELRKLFDLLAEDELTVNRRVLIDIISNFDLPLKSEDFFIPVGKKENLSFSDFCLLFKNNNSSIGEEFIKSFTSGFTPEKTVVENLFPVTINKMKGYNHTHS